MVEEHVCQVRVDLDLHESILAEASQPPSGITSARQAILRPLDRNAFQDIYVKDVEKLWSSVLRSNFGAATKTTSLASPPLA